MIVGAGATSFTMICFSVLLFFPSSSIRPVTSTNTFSNVTSKLWLLMEGENSCFSPICTRPSCVRLRYRTDTSFDSVVIEPFTVTSLNSSALIGVSPPSNVT